MPQSFDRRFRFRITAGVAMTMLAASVPVQGASEPIVENQVEQPRFEGYASDEIFWMTRESFVAR